MSKPHYMNLIVVCHGNVARSPSVAYLLEHHGWPREKLRSRGLKVSARSKRILRKVRDGIAAREYPGILEHEHVPLQLTEDDLAWADAILYMDGGNLKRLEAMDADRQTILIPAGAYADEPRTRVADPAFLAKASDDFHDVMDILVQVGRNFYAASTKGESDDDS